MRFLDRLYPFKIAWLKLSSIIKKEFSTGEYILNLYFQETYIFKCGHNQSTCKKIPKFTYQGKIIYSTLKQSFRMKAFKENCQSAFSLDFNDQGVLLNGGDFNLQGKGLIK